MVKRILVVSDTHGSIVRFNRILEISGNVDLIIHAGDYLYHGPRNRIPEGYNPAELGARFKMLRDKLVGVRGNCDADVDLMIMEVNELPWHRLECINSMRFLIYHGHRTVEIDDANVVISGHSHIHELKKHDGKLILNPGSPSLPKDSTSGTFGLIEFGKIMSVYIYDLNGVILKREVLG
ncbi:phosphodiesterase [Kosmotoga pacifica]|uniref:Phosphoesterase n=1 Tax=Kosmotoga pacifica TaxID=1330330 RepID=A0A0G2ZAR8_9BACT|nr:phosphodiesterase [Kosmotoga pacifica]AKI97191.1 hypothetical protein IX53_04490 [Kosmotoga pacifica]